MGVSFVHQSSRLWDGGSRGERPALVALEERGGGLRPPEASGGLRHLLWRPVWRRVQSRSPEQRRSVAVTPCEHGSTGGGLTPHRSGERFQRERGVVRDQSMFWREEERLRDQMVSEKPV